MELDNDLRARQEARTLCKQAECAATRLAEFPQEKLDAIVEAVARAFADASQELAALAAGETGFGNEKDKAEKNRFASERVARAVRPMQCVGILNATRGEKLWEIGVPVGVIAAIVPSTNPTSTVCYKAIIALKAGNAIVFSPHPKALQCTLRAASIVAQAAEQAGAPRGSIACLSIPAMAGCKELMSAPEVRLILATGGPAMVRAAYSSGKPAIGVGAGNGPAYIHRSADVREALSCILRSKTFDNGTVCASEQSIIVERDMARTVRDTAQKMGFYFMKPDESERLARILFRPNGSLNPDVVGKCAQTLAKMAQIDAPNARVLVGEGDRVGADSPYSREKICPVLGFFTVDSQDAVLQKTQEILHFEGSGHTFTIHARDKEVIERFARCVSVSRFLVNTPAALGGIGATTELFPALTLGCGAVGGSASSNNISPMDLINIRRIAWDVQDKPQSEVGMPAHIDAGLIDQLAEKILARLDAHMQ